MGQGFLKAGIREIVTELCIDLRPMGECPGGDGLGNFLQSFQVVRGVPVPPSVVANDADALAEKMGQFGGHGTGRGLDAANDAQSRRTGQPKTKTTAVRTQRLRGGRSLIGRGRGAAK